tara:strand:+ start:736 stop:2508 length:1773 start_codon:yes stop_codon:yes gene_type:complete
MVREFSANVKDIKAVLRTEGKSYEIPRYQRGYSWKNSQVSSFWNDLIEEEYGLFIGTILMNQGDKLGQRVEIIDGQQRLLTITILFSSIRDALEKIGGGGAYRAVQAIQERYIEHEEGFDEEKEVKILVSKSIRNYFENLIVSYPRNEEDIEPTTDEEKRVRATKKFFDSNIKKSLKSIDGDGDKIAWLKGLADRVGRLKVVAIDVSDQEDAYTVFESVNAKGAQLTLADILKSLIFRRVPETAEEDRAQRQWDKMIANLDGTGFTISKFIRYYWLSKFGFLTETKLYSAIKDKLEREGTMTWEELLDELVSNSRNLRVLKDAEYDSFYDYNSTRQVTNALKGISLMNVSQVYVLLMSMHRNMSMKKKWEREFKALEDFSFNYHTVGKGQAVRVEKKYSEWAQQIENLNKIEDKEKRSGELEEILKRALSNLQELRDQYVPEVVFIPGFIQELDYSKARQRPLIAYVLKRIDDHYSGGTGEYVINPHKVNLEHVLPQKPEQWNLDSSDVEEYVNEIGNLTILSKKLNSEAGNKPLKEKITILEKSEITITQSLVRSINEEGVVWNEDSIHNRSMELAKTSYDEIWNLGSR